MKNHQKWSTACLNGQSPTASDWEARKISRHFQQLPDEANLIFCATGHILGKPTADFSVTARLCHPSELNAYRLVAGDFVTLLGLKSRSGGTLMVATLPTTVGDRYKGTVASPLALRSVRASVQCVTRRDVTPGNCHCLFDGSELLLGRVLTYRADHRSTI